MTAFQFDHHQAAEYRSGVRTLSSTEAVAELRAQIAAVPSAVRPPLPFGVEPIDHRLAHRGLELEALHEVAPASAALADDAAATLFLAGLAGRLARARGAQVLWALTRFDLYAPGLEQAGLRADAVLFAQGRDEPETLALAEDGARDGSLAAVVIETRRVSMVATRRLQLAAGTAGAPVLMLRRWRKAGSCPLVEPSTAATRWRIGCAPSAPLGLPGVGRPRWSVELVRQRGGAPFSLLLEACDDQGRLALPAPVRHRAAPADRAIARAA